MALNMIENLMIELVGSDFESESDLIKRARTLSSKAGLPPIQKSELLKAYHKLVKNGKITPNKKFEQQLTKRAIRTLSGVAVVSVLTKPQSCPGNCLFCPTEKNMPKSYLSNEPAVMRAVLNDFDPYRQVKMRLKALAANGHATSKIELIVMGGTWSHHSPKYQSWFIRRCFEALNAKASRSLLEAQKMNESATHRCVGLTLETRPDYINAAEIKRLRQLGCTRVELGIQHTDDKILKLNRRGHTAKQSVAAIKLLKDAGFKLNLHLMPNMYGSTPAADLAMFKKIYNDGEYMPDMIKIYPCVVNEHSDLYKLYRQKKYKPYTDKQLLDLLIKIKRMTPPWVRIARLIRDIPEESIIAGNKITNLRQLIGNEAAKNDWKCQCIRCREAGHQHNQPANDYVFKNIAYQASKGQEFFLSIESEDSAVLYAFLRLRLPERPENAVLKELAGAALIREVHTYGQLAELGNKGEVQHLGLGKWLLVEAEKIAKQQGVKKIAVISGIGARKYYEKSDYRLHGSYMVKNLE